MTLSSIRCLTLFLTFLDYSFFKNTITIYLFNYLMSLSFSSCRVVFTSLIFILISFCLFCDMINSGIMKALIFWTLIYTRWMVLWSMRLTQVFCSKVYFSWFYKACLGYFIFSCHLSKKYYYFRVGLPCWDAIIVLAMLLLENVTLMYVTVSIPSTSSQHGFRVLLSLVH